jgi:auxin-responsive protein IAA
MEIEMNLRETELSLGLPGRRPSEELNLIKNINNKRPLILEEELNQEKDAKSETAPPSTKAQIVGWPPIRSYRKNNIQGKKSDESTELSAGRSYVKVSMDGAPYLRKTDLKCYNGYGELLMALEKMFKFTIDEYSEREGSKGYKFTPTYEDKDGDWMLVGDVPWEMFLTSCKRLRIMKRSDTKGLGCGVWKT